MIDSKYRNPYQKLVIDPLSKISWIRRTDPIMLTFFALFFGLIIPFFLYLGCPKIALFCLIFSGLFDTLDGSVARMNDQMTDEGAAFDIASDRIVEFAVIFGLFCIAPQDRAPHCLFMLGSILFCVTTFLTVGIFTRKDSEKSFFYSPGIMERTEAFLFFGAMILFPQIFSVLSVLFTLLVTLTGVVRLYQFYIRNLLSECPKDEIGN